MNDMKNIKYKSSTFLNYYSKKRMTWEEYYESEKVILDRIIKKAKDGIDIMDVGCGCGGLGKALSETFDNINSYVGIDYSDKEIEYAKKYNKLNIPYEYRCDDAATFSDEKRYDIVVSFSCIDFNIEVYEMLKNCWDKVKPGGYLVTSIRLTEKESINDISRAYQLLSDTKETCNYVVFNLNDFLKEVMKLKNNPADEIQAYGYWHSPASGTVCEYSQLCMSVFAIRKAYDAQIKKPALVKLDLPCDLFVKENI